ncbi:MAG: DUF1579 family protein [Planctomycetaceae bacterium]
MSNRLAMIVCCAILISGCEQSEPEKPSPATGETSAAVVPPAVEPSGQAPTIEEPSKSATTAPPETTASKGRNLINDPSLEATAVGEKYPVGWGGGNLVPADSYRMSVVEEGRTGERGWMIEGEGQYAVIPTIDYQSRPQIDRARRYAARGWVRLDAGAAQLKILYFDADRRYIGENRGAIFTQPGDWHVLTLTDDLEHQPEARYLCLALALIGKGKAVFDDVEFASFDADRLPENFEADYASSPHHTPAMFDRWVGRWKTISEHQATATTEAKTAAGETVIRKLLDDRLLLWQYTSDTGDPQYASLLAFDENIGAHHLWVFGSAGEAFERTGTWDAASQTLLLQLKPPSPGVTGASADRFVDDDRIESTLLVKNAAGDVTRDVRTTSTRTAPVDDADIELSSGPVADDEQLAVLQKLVGDWTTHAISKPTEGQPLGKDETFTEQVSWFLGGRFLIFRAYDEKNRLTSLSLMTHRPNDDAYRFWYFGPYVHGGQWRVTWDEPSREFHWRAADMPPGWTGTGLNRWIDDDTFANQIFIQDDQGRVVTDATQDKRRKK